MGIPRSTFYDAPAVASGDGEILASIIGIYARQPVKPAA